MPDAPQYVDLEANRLQARPRKIRHRAHRNEPLPTLKISARRLSDFGGPRRTKPPVNRQKRELAEQLLAEGELIATLMRDAAVRAAFEAGAGVAREPMSVWTDSDQSYHFTELAPKHLPKWHKLSEAMKMFIAFDLGMEHRACFSFTANIEPKLLAGWDANGSDIMPNLEQRLRRALKRRGITSLPFAYVVETKAKRGKSPARPHIHGLALCEEPLDATRFKVALEQAFVPGLTWRGRGRAIKVERSFDKDAPLVGEFVGRGSWISYIIKNAQRYDRRLGKRRVFISHSLTDLIREAWAVRRED